MKRECPSLFAALLVSLLVNVLLRSETAYWPRAGLFSAVLCTPLLAAVGWLFARCWRLAADPVYKLLFAALLVYTSVLELLRLWQLAGRLYQKRSGAFLQKQYNDMYPVISYVEDTVNA